MKKLVLDLDTVRVESFQTAPAPAERGTVIGAQLSQIDFTYCTCHQGCHWTAPAAK